MTDVTAPYTVVTYLYVPPQLGARCKTERWALPPATCGLSLVRESHVSSLCQRPMFLMSRCSK